PLFRSDGAGAAFEKTQKRAAAARVELDSAFAAANARIATAIREVAADPSFREALAWQNRAVLERTIAPMLAGGTGRRNVAERRNEELIANYVQRYCTKNDTIGFFGPIGWATW